MWATFSALPRMPVPQPLFLSVDGIGAFDHVLRSAMLCR